jgi:hypothetical protein
MNANFKVRTMSSLGILLAFPGITLAVAGTDQVAWKGRPVQMKSAWPEGVGELINDEVRTDGWNPWFSECSNDSTYYGLDVRSREDVDRLIRKLSNIKTDGLEVNLDPTAGARHAGNVGAVFSIGNQDRLNQWFKRLPEVEPGIRRFGLHRYEKPPAAQVPTLTLYVGHKAVDLNSLEIPKNVRVVTATGKDFRADHKDAFQVIDKFIEQHNAKSSPE